MLDLLATFVDKLPEEERASFLDALHSTEASIKTQIVLDSVNSLNMMLESDPFTINKMFCDLSACSPSLASSPAEVVQLYDKGFYVGILGVVNGCLNSRFKIVPVFADQAGYPYPIKQFTVTEVI